MYTKSNFLHNKKIYFLTISHKVEVNFESCSKTQRPSKQTFSGFFTFAQYMYTKSIFSFNNKILFFLIPLKSKTYVHSNGQALCKNITIRLSVWGATYKRRGPARGLHSVCIGIKFKLIETVEAVMFPQDCDN